MTIPTALAIGAPVFASLAEIAIISLVAAWAFSRMRVPGLVGMLLVGVAFGPYALGMIDPRLMDIAGELRQAALIVILLRAGFELSRGTLNRVGRQAGLLSFIPATFEIATITLVAPTLLGLTRMEAALLGTVLAAVSPAVVVPLMIRFIKERRGVDKGIPTMVLAAASFDDVFCIVVFGAAIGLYTGESVNVAARLAGIPVSIALGIGVGLLAGFVLYRIFDRFNPRATKRLIAVLMVAVLLVRLGSALPAAVPFAALVAVMALGFIILERREHMAHEISAKLGKAWVLAEIVLFSLTGAQVDVGVAVNAGLAGLAVICIGLAGRSMGTLICLVGSGLTPAERAFVAVAYLPKATVQAAIGAAPLAAMAAAGMDTAPGQLILAVAVTSIIFTAPLGATAATFLGERVLKVAPAEEHESYDAAVESEADAETL